MLGNIFQRKRPEPVSNFSQQQGLSISLDIEEDQEDYQSHGQEMIEAGAKDVGADSQDQIKFGLQTSRVTRIQRLRNSIRSWENLVQVLPFWKNEVNTINITFSFLAIIGMGLFFTLNYTKLPTKIPLFYQQADGTWLIVDKTVLVILLIVFALFEIILIRLKRVIFNFDRRLSGVMAITQIFFNVMAVIAVLQIASLVLI